MRTLLLILLFIAVPLAGGSLRPEQESDFWKESGIDLAFAKHVINDRDCESSKQYFSSCRKALLHGAQLLKIEGWPEFKKLKVATLGKKFKFEALLTRMLRVQSPQPIEHVIGKIINAQLKVFDPYARLIPSSFSRLLLNGENKTYYGIGVETDATGAGLFIFQVYPGTPASQAGLRVHDRIVSLNGISAKNLSQAQAMSARLGGREGETLTIEVERDGQRLAPLRLQIAPIFITESPVQEFELAEKRFLQIRLRSFSHGTCADLSAKIQAAQSKPLHGLILDLRHNIGGLVNEGECVARLFAGAKPVVGREPLRLGLPRFLDFQPPKGALDGRSGLHVPAYFAELPLIVLINAKSASASEILAGALQDYGRVWIVGERSFGKGTTQLLHSLPEYPKLKITKTVSRYVRPSGLSVHELGVIPNFEVPFKAGADVSARRFVREEDVRSGIKLPLGERWFETRVQAAGAVRLCLMSNELLPQAKTAVISRLGYEDHQATFALAALNCP